jgi:hypothetical protein
VESKQPAQPTDGLSLWNGGVGAILPEHGSTAHCFAAAESRADLLGMLAAAFGLNEEDMDEYIRVHWWYGSWGTVMGNQERERGIWVMDGAGLIHKAYPKPLRLSRSRPV